MPSSPRSPSGVQFTDRLLSRRRLVASPSIVSAPPPIGPGCPAIASRTLSERNSLLFSQERRDVAGGGERISVGEGKSVSVRVNLGGRRVLYKKKRAKKIYIKEEYDERRK